MSRQGLLIGLALTVFSLLMAAPLNAGVDELWADRWDGQGHLWDIPFSMTTDAQGNVYVTGSSQEIIEDHPDYATLKYDSLGNLAWASYFDGPTPSCDIPYELVVDADGNVFVAGASDPYDEFELSIRCDDFAIVKYDAMGNEVWVTRYDGEFCDLPNAIALDADGNIYAAGYTETATTRKDMFLVKLDPAGDTVWTRSYNGPGNVDDWIWDMAVDPAGDIYVTGGSYGSGSFLDLVTIKYDSDGNQGWLHRYAGPAGELDEGLAMALDGSGNLYVTGYSYGFGTSKDVLTAKYDTSGTVLWIETYDGSAEDWDQGRTLAVAPDGGLYVTGGTTGSVTGRDFLLIRYLPNGDTAWVRTYDSGAEDSDYAGAVGLDQMGDVYIAGQSFNSAGNEDFATLRYDSAGELLDVRRYDGAFGGEDRTLDLVIDNSGNVYVSGESESDSTETDFVTIKYRFYTGMCGDADGNSLVNISDAVYLIAYIFGGGPAPSTTREGDPDCNELVNISDAVFLIAFIFGGGPQPCATCS